MTTTATSPMLHRFVLEIRSPEGKPIHDVKLEKADFARAIEATFFEALRQGAFSEYIVPMDRASIEPSHRSDSPKSAGFEVVLHSPTGEHRQHFGLDYFKTLARSKGAQLALSGKIAPDATVTFGLAAYADELKPVKRPGLTISLEEESTIPISPGQHGVSEAWDGAKADEFPVIIPRHVLEESVAEARQCPEREVGGVLLGHLRRDPQGELFLEVTCLVPCEETEATKVSVTFTHETWARVREVVAWRGEGELIVGWMHSHPFRLCAECPNPVPSECQGKILFYSIDDEFLMELTFARPFMVGLLAAVEPKLAGTLGHVPVKLYGWKGGVIVPRGFEVVE